MATIYKATIVSDWISYSEEHLEKVLNKAMKEVERKKGNTIKIKITEKR